MFSFQIIDLTGCSQDKAEIALYDNKNDMDRAVNMLLEGEVDQVSSLYIFGLATNQRQNAHRQLVLEFGFITN